MFAYRLVLSARTGGARWCSHGGMHAEEKTSLSGTKITLRLQSGTEVLAAFAAVRKSANLVPEAEIFTWAWQRALNVRLLNFGYHCPTDCARS